MYICSIRIMPLKPQKKAVDRGNRAISTVLHASFIVFLPAVVQVMASAAMIYLNCGAIHAGTLLATSAVYSFYSIKYIEYRMPFRIDMNKAYFGFE